MFWGTDHFPHGLLLAKMQGNDVIILPTVSDEQAKQE